MDNYRVILPPVLGFSGSTDTKWFLCAVYVTKGEIQSGSRPELSLHDPSGCVSTFEGEPIRQWRDFTIWRFQFYADMRETERTHLYTISKAECLYPFAVPARGCVPHIAFASGNGSSNDDEPSADAASLWSVIEARHTIQAYHLLIMGGENVNTDEIWNACASVGRHVMEPMRRSLVLCTCSKAKPKGSKPELSTAAWSPEMEVEVRDFFLAVYLQSWGQQDRSWVLSRIPSLMMWDDHDIIQGYGSYAPEVQRCGVFQGIFNIARDYFWSLQLKAIRTNLLHNPSSEPWRIWDPVPGPFSQLVTAGPVAILILDTRSERTCNEVISGQTLKQLHTALASIGTLRYLLVVSPSPLMFVPMHQPHHPPLSPHRMSQDSEYCEHWYAPRLHEARHRVLTALFNYSTRSRTRVVVLSGDTRVGALGRILTATCPLPIYQLISSALVRSPPGLKRKFWLSLRWWSETVDHITFEQLPIQGRRFLWARNVLSLVPQHDSYWAAWSMLSGTPSGNVHTPDEVVYNIPLDF